MNTSPSGAATPRFSEFLSTVQENADHAAPLLAAALLEDAWNCRSTDIHIIPVSGGGGFLVRFRVDGRLAEAARLAAEDGQRLMRYWRSAAGLNPVGTVLPEVASLTIGILSVSLDLRFSFTSCHTGETVAIRILNQKRIRRPLDTLGLAADDVASLRLWLEEADGMCLVAGPTGSGKTTTLYALLHEVSQRDQAIVTLEDPVEYAVDGITQIGIHESQGLDFAVGIKSILRLDPDIILVGEMRDAVSAQAVAEAAASGHIVLSTLHGSSPPDVLSLLQSWGLTGHQIAATTRLILCQRLIRRLCGKCRFQAPPDETERSWLQRARLTLPGLSWHPKGCDECTGTGYKGRIGVFNLWRSQPGSSEPQAASHSLAFHGLQKVLSGETSLAELRSLPFAVSKIPHD